jgi:hypothetical protein
MKIRASKAHRVVLLSGLFLMVGGALLSKMHMPGSTFVQVGARVLLLVACVQLLLSPFNRPKYFPESGGISMTSLNAFAGVLMLLPGILSVVGGWHVRYMSMAGLVLFLVGFVWGMVRLATSKSYAVDEPILSDEQLNALSGSFINLDLGMRITVELHGRKLLVQAEGQPAVALQVVDSNTLKGAYATVQMMIAYDAEHNGFVLKQHGGMYPFERAIAG